jgi:hypothetical protein
LSGGASFVTIFRSPKKKFETPLILPRTFFDKMRALKLDPATGKPDPETFTAFLDSHPDNRGQAKFLDDNNPPKSYANAQSTCGRIRH